MDFTPTEPKRRHSRPSTSQAQPSSHSAVVQNRQKKRHELDEQILFASEPFVPFACLVGQTGVPGPPASYSIVTLCGPVASGHAACLKQRATFASVRLCFIFLFFYCRCPVFRNARYGWPPSNCILLTNVLRTYCVLLRRPRIASGKISASLNGAPV